MNPTEDLSLNKIAKITILFWLMKIVATTLGETLGDFIAQTLNLGYLAGIGITLLFFLFALYLQLEKIYFLIYSGWSL